MLEKHCRACGAALIEKELKGEGVVPFCPVCGEFRFPMYNVAVSMIVIDRQSEKILLVQQYGKPSYILVAGYVNRTESLESAVAREIKEETGMTVQFYGVCGRRQRILSQRGDRRLRVVWV